MNQDPEYDRWLDLLNERESPWEELPADPNHPPQNDKETDPF